MEFSAPKEKESPLRIKAHKDRIGRPGGDRRQDDYDIKTEDSNVSAEQV